MSLETIPSTPAQGRRVFKRLPRDRLETLAGSHPGYRRALELSTVIQGEWSADVQSALSAVGVNAIGYEVVVDGSVPDSPFPGVSDAIGLTAVWFAAPEATAWDNPFTYLFAIQGRDRYVALESSPGSTTRGGFFVARFGGDTATMTPRSWFEGIAGTTDSTVNGEFVGVGTGWSFGNLPDAWYGYGSNLDISGDDPTVAVWWDVRFDRFGWLLAQLGLRADSGDEGPAPPSPGSSWGGARGAPGWSVGPYGRPAAWILNMGRGGRPRLDALSFQRQDWEPVPRAGATIRAAPPPQRPLDRYREWQDIVSFRPTHVVQSRAESMPGGGRIHRLEDGWGQINLDYYPVLIERLPTGDGGRMTPEELLAHIRKNFNDFVDTDWGQFEPYGSETDDAWNTENAERWNSTDPLGTVVHIDIGGPDNGSVIVSLAELRRWRFSTLWTEVDAGHPVSGNREWGIRDNRNGTYTFYTRAADRLTAAPDWAAGWIGIPFCAADLLWKSLQEGVRTYVNDNGGRATTAAETSVRLDWEEVRARFHSPTVTWQ